MHTTRITHTHAHKHAHRERERERGRRVLSVFGCISTPAALRAINVILFEINLRASIILSRRRYGMKTNGKRNRPLKLVKLLAGWAANGKYQTEWKIRRRGIGLQAAYPWCMFCYGINNDLLTLDTGIGGQPMWLVVQWAVIVCECVPVIERVCKRARVF